MNKKYFGPRVLFLDIETAPILGSVWQLFDQNVALNMIERDWFILSISAKWMHKDEVMYRDSRGKRNIENDGHLLRWIWRLLDECDVVVTQNGNAFDLKKMNARFILSGMNPPSSYKKIDTKLIAKKCFAFTSNKLEYMTDKICTKYKKLKHKKFPGFELWAECLKGNLAAWQEMEEYNRHDVLSLEELWMKLRPWDNSINFNLYTAEDAVDLCKCGHKFVRKGFHYTAVGKFQRYRCTHCGAQCRSRDNLFSKDKKWNLRSNVPL